MSDQNEIEPKAGDNSPAFAVSEAFARKDTPSFELTIWPNRSMPRKGFHQVLLFTAAMLTLPLIPVLGSPIGWALLPFLLGTLFLLWFFIRWNYRDGRLHEILKLWPDLITVERIDPKGGVKRWHANPFWVRTEMRKDGKVENYLTLIGNGREIELGAFLSPEERATLRDDIDRALGQSRRTNLD